MDRTREWEEGAHFKMQHDRFQRSARDLVERTKKVLLIYSSVYFGQQALLRLV